MYKWHCTDGSNRIPNQCSIATISTTPCQLCALVEIIFKLKKVKEAFPIDGVLKY